MLSNVQQLYDIALKPSRIIIGLMSGTSFDGLDVALCKVTGNGSQTVVEVLEFETVNYPSAFKEDLKEVFAKKQTDLGKVTLLNESIGNYFAEIVLSCLAKWNIKALDVDLIASHGQTIYHAPQRLHHDITKPNGTLQIGDGDHIAVKTGIITISDFRQKHLAAGGEGAPLAVYGDYLLFSTDQESRIMLNIGGIANFTWLPQSRELQKVFSTDVGPGNTLMDQYIQTQLPGQYFDVDSSIAKTGTVDQALLKELKHDPFFESDFPKTTGAELFSAGYLNRAQQNSGSLNLSLQDMLATLSRFSAETIADAVLRCVGNNNYPVIYVSGGGMHNPLLMQTIQHLLPNIVIKETGTLGISPDAKEAVLFAVLANENIAGKAFDWGQGRGLPSVTMGKISFP